MSTTFYASVQAPPKGDWKFKAIVRQQVGANTCIPIACLEIDMHDCDYCHIDIQYAGGKLSFGAAYDACGSLHDWKFIDGTLRSCMDDVALHYSAYTGQSYFCTHNGFYPIARVSREPLRLAVYKPNYQAHKEGLVYPLLATIAGIKKQGKDWEYTIEVEEPIPNKLLMAIFTLPFTAASGVAGGFG